ncbi:MAG TPA: hypothetical protein ENJ01_03315 [Gammaproteobacteria bacterium]|nr:hypothetical protein [Gammaproteobacteria bacterium]
MKIIQYAICALALTWGNVALAADQFSSSQGDALRPIIELGLYVGGDDLATVQFVGGTSETIETGGLVDFNVGFVKTTAPNQEIQFTIGYRFDGITAVNGTVDWSRTVLEGKYFFLDGRSRLGVGLTYHLSPDLEIDIAGFLPTVVSFDDALGFVGEWDYMFNNQGYFGLKYTIIDYETGGVSADGNSLGFLIGYIFP